MPHPRSHLPTLHHMISCSKRTSHYPPLLHSSLHFNEQHTRLSDYRVSTPSTALHSPESKFDVFISHAGDEKATIAIPLPEKLSAHGINAFVDAPDLQPGEDAPQAMTDAMKTATVAVIVLSPEFVSRRWPMRELMFFLKRREKCAATGQAGPLVIPFFYRLKIEELYDEPRLDRRDKNGNLLYKTPESKFYERQTRGEHEANIEAIKAALMNVRRLTGLTNFIGASNESSYEMSRTRDMLLEELCNIVGQALPRRPMKILSKNESDHDQQTSVCLDRFRKFFPPLSSGVRAILDFDSRDVDGNSKTTEGLIKQHLLEEASNSPHVVSVCGIGGVGKSTILQALSVDEQVKQRFPDGIHMIRLGKDASNTTLFRELCRVLQESGAEKTVQSLRSENNIDEALRFFEKWFNGKRCAFLIDDAWMRGVEINSLSCLCKIGSQLTGNSVLIATRKHKVASFATSKRIIQLNPREARGRDSRRILFFHAHHEDTDHSLTSVEDSINRILDICDGLPVSLAIAGKNLKMMSTGIENGAQYVWKEYLSEVKTYRDRPLRENVENYGNMFATFVTTITSLDKRRREETLGFTSSLSCNKMFRRLCVLQKQVSVSMLMLRQLWETETKQKRI